MKAIHNRENEKWIKVDALEDVFFYTLYKFNAYWIAGEVSERIAKRIYRDLDVNVHGYKIEINGKGMKHFFSEHFNEKIRGQRKISVQDIKMVLEVVNNASEITFGNNMNRLLFITRFPNGLFHFVVEINEKRKTLLGKAFWIKA